MLESLHIQNFRKFKEFTFHGFGQVNFILGENNAGKTTALEAVYTWACGQNSAPLLVYPLSRGRYSNNQSPFWVMEELLSIPYDRHSLPLHMIFDGIYDNQKECFEHTIYPSELLAQLDSSYINDMVNTGLPASETSQNHQIMPAGFPIQTTRIADWEIQHNGQTVKTQFTVPYMAASTTKPFRAAKFIDLLSYASISDNAQMYAKLKREGLLREVADEMQAIFPQIKGFDMIPYPDGSQAPISIENQDGNYLPMYTYGDGVQKWFYILGSFASYKNSIMCIDEVDTGFHPAAQVRFCVSMIQSALKNGIQLFLTTHNIEFMDNLLKTMVKYPEWGQIIRIITLRNTVEGLQSRNLSASEANQARERYNLELR